MGRTRTPDAVKAAKGNPGKRKLVETAENDPAKTAPDANDVRKASATPAKLSVEGKKIWARVTDDLARMSFIRVQDREALSRYCEHLAKWWTLTQKIRKEGDTYWTKTKHGDMKRINPLILIRDRIEGRMESLEDKFGLNPRARQLIIAGFAQGGGAGDDTDLFGNKRGDAPAATEAEGQQPGPGAMPESPIGLLN